MSEHPGAKPGGFQGAAGRYQFIYDTYKDYKDNHGQFNDFGPSEQDRAAVKLLDRIKVSQSSIEAAISSGEWTPVFDKLARIWASIPYSKPLSVSRKGIPDCHGCGSGNSYYPYYGGKNKGKPQPNKNPSDIKDVFDTCYKYHQNPPASAASGVKTDFLGQLRGGKSSRIGYDFFILHDGGAFSSDCSEAVQKVINLWRSKATEISSHYYICKDGTVHQLLDEEKSGIHAGRSDCPEGLCPIKNANRRSIGIDFQNWGGTWSDGGKYTDEQYQAANQLMADISKRRGIPLDDQHILAHYEVTKSPASTDPGASISLLTEHPFYKSDPYYNFDWSKIHGVNYNHWEKNAPWMPALVTDETLAKVS